MPGHGLNIFYPFTIGLGGHSPLLIPVILKFNYYFGIKLNLFIIFLLFQFHFTFLISKVSCEMIDLKKCCITIDTKE